MLLIATDTIKTLRDLLEYPKHDGNICSDLEVVSFLLELQLGHTKHMYFLCLWDSRQDSRHYAVKIWLARQTIRLVSIMFIVQYQPLVSSANVLLPFRIKLD